MKKCNSCSVSFDGDRKTCPFCQSSLTGTPTEWNFVSAPKLKKQAFFYKLQLAIVLAICAIALALDFLLDLNPGPHYSLTILLWSITLEVTIRGFIKNHAFPAKIISISAVIGSVLLGLTSLYYGFFTPIFYVAIPCVIGANIIVNFVFCFIDKHGNALVYLLSTILIGAIPYIAIYFGKETLRLPWTICLIISIIALISIIVFKGRQVKNEIAKRFNF